MTRTVSPNIGPRIDQEAVAKQVVDSAIQVHKSLGPGLLESVYQACLAYELEERGYSVLCEVPLPVRYKNMQVDTGYRVDMVVNECVIIENKAVEALSPVHSAQLITYLRLSGCHIGFLVNWNVHLIKDGIHRIVN